MSRYTIGRGAVYVAVCPRCAELGHGAIIGEATAGGVVLRAHEDVWRDHVRQLSGHIVEVVDARTSQSIHRLGAEGISRSTGPTRYHFIHGQSNRERG